MKRIIIEYPTHVGAESAMNRVLSVITKSPRSEATVEGVPTEHYCWCTTFVDGSQVITRQKRRRDSADSFLVEFPLVEVAG